MIKATYAISESLRGVSHSFCPREERQSVSLEKNNDNNNKKIIKEKGKRYGTKDLRLTFSYIKFLKGATKL